MDRKIPRLRRDWRNPVVRLLTVAAVVTVLGDQTFGQRRLRGGRRGGFDAPAMFDRFDRNGDGRLDADEISSSRFLPRMLGETDTSRGLSRDEFDRALQQARENFQRNGFGRRDRDRDDGSRSGGGNSDGTDGENSEDSGEPSNKSGKTRPRITIDLQTEFLPGDQDHDGQIGFYEWRRFAGRSMSEFRELDRNRDGFVTPREVAIARPDLDASATESSAKEQAGRTTSRSNARDESASPQADSRASAQAGQYFRLLDRNRDGQIDSEEWERSRRIRSMFTSDGIDLGKPMTADEFAGHYIRLSARGN